MNNRYINLKTCTAIMAASVAASFQTLPASAEETSSSAVSVSGVAFVDDSGDEDCRVVRGAGFASYAADAEASVEDCDLVAGIQLPQDARMKSMKCGVRDEYNANMLQLDLLRVELATGQIDYVFTTNGSVDSGVMQVLSDAAPETGKDIVDNNKFTYYLSAAFSYTNFTNIGTAMRVYGCTVEIE